MEIKNKPAKNCKHRWHFVKEFYFDEWDSLTSSKRYPRGNYSKFVCESCGEIKFILEEERKQ
jgi:hypothetical protein